MADFYLKSVSGVISYSAKTWALGEKMVPARADVGTNYLVGRKWVWECTTAGTSTGTPTWPASVTQDTTTVTEAGGVVWTARKPGFSSGTIANWAFAAIYADYVVAALAAGDTLWVSQLHAENVAASVVWPASAGTPTNPIKILCGNDASAPPVSLTTGAIIEVSGAVTNDLSVNQISAMIHGLYFKASGNMNVGGHTAYDGTTRALRLNSCTLELTDASATAKTMSISGANHQGTFELQDCWFKLNSTAKLLTPNNGLQARTNIVGGGFLAGTYSPVFIFNDTVNQGVVTIADFDFSLLPAAVSVFRTGSSTRGGNVSVKNSKMPVGWTGSVTNSAPLSGQEATLHNVDAVATNYRYERKTYAGNIVSETTKVLSSGAASDGTTAISLMLDGINANLVSPLRTEQISKWNETTGSTMTVSVQVAYDSATLLKDSEIWLEVEYLGVAAQPIGNIASSAPANHAIAAGTNLVDTVVAWNGTWTNKKTHTLSVTLTPQMKGYLQATVKLINNSVNVYVNPDVTVA